jgi:molybdate transport system ATP-binding protein
MSLYVDITKKYKDFILNTRLESKAHWLGILGASGCGKSLTLKCIAGVEKPDFGKIILNDRVLFDSEKKINIPPQKRNIGLMFQNYALFPNMTVKENIEVGISGLQKKKNPLNELLYLFHLENFKNKYPSQLSGGQQQRVALARILACKPELLLLDEPFSALDSYLKEKLRQEIYKVLSDYYGDVVIVSHDRDELYQLCDRLAVIDRGSTIIDGDTSEVFRNPRKLKSARLTGCKNISAARRISDYSIYAIDWGIRLETNNIVSIDTKYVGIRAHDIRPGKGEDINSFKIISHTIAESPFDIMLILTCTGCKELTNKIWWKFSKAYWRDNLLEKVPERIYFPEENIILLS